MAYMHDISDGMVSVMWDITYLCVYATSGPLLIVLNKLKIPQMHHDREYILHLASTMHR